MRSTGYLLYMIILYYHAIGHCWEKGAHLYHEPRSVTEMRQRHRLQ